MTEAELWSYAAILAAGVAAGFINTMAGGGSLLTLPALMLLGMPATDANGTNRLAVVTQSMSGVLAFHREGRLDTKAIVPVAGPTIVGAIAGSWVAAISPDEVLKPVLLAVLGGLLRYDAIRGNALKLVCTLLFGVAALAVFVWHDQVRWIPAGVLAVATVIGSQLGVRFAVKTNATVLRGIIFVCVAASCVAAFFK